jgi:hypothetical protein
MLEQCVVNPRLGLQCSPQLDAEINGHLIDTSTFPRHHFIVKQQTKTHLQKAYKRAAIMVMQVKYKWMSENGNQ